MEHFDWNTQNECYLLESMSGHKPVGVNKAFQMLCIYDKFKARIEKEVESQALWIHLGTMYNLDALDENEDLPFPNDEIDFELPDFDYAQLKEFKAAKKAEAKLEENLLSLNGKDILKQEEKLVVNIINDIQRRDSKDSRSSSTSSKKDKEIVKKENDRSNKSAKNKSLVKTDTTPKLKKSKDGDKSGKPVKRPTRGSLKADDSSSSGKSSPVTVTPTPGKKRRVK